MYFPEIEKLFGTPLNEVPRPSLPFISPKTKKVLLIVGAAFAAIEVYTIVKKVNPYIEDKKMK